MVRARAGSGFLVMSMAMLFALSGCSNTSSTSEASALERVIRRTAVTERPAAISADDDYFLPKLVKVRAGADITFTNDGRRVHNVIPVDGGGFRIDTDELRPRMSHTVRISEPGTYRYFCSIHGTATSGMRGAIAVVR